MRAYTKEDIIQLVKLGRFGTPEMNSIVFQMVQRINTLESQIAQAQSTNESISTPNIPHFDHA
jgi:hypothetical protein